MAQRLRFNTAKDLFEAFPAALEDMDARPSDRSSLEFVKDLASGPTPEDAITFTAYLLVHRETVWWGHQCLTTLPEHLAPEDLRLLEFAEAWVRQPDEQRRNVALESG